MSLTVDVTTHTSLPPAPVEATLPLPASSIALQAASHEAPSGLYPQVRLLTERDWEQLREGVISNVFATYDVHKTRGLSSPDDAINRKLA